MTCVRACCAEESGKRKWYQLIAPGIRETAGDSVRCALLTRYFRRILMPMWRCRCARRMERSTLNIRRFVYACAAAEGTVIQPDITYTRYAVLCKKGPLGGEEKYN